MFRMSNENKAWSSDMLRDVRWNSRLCPNVIRQKFTDVFSDSLLELNLGNY